MPKKLGLLSAKATPCKVTLMGAPEGFRELLGDLPAQVRFVPGMTPDTNLAICFVRNLPDLGNTLEILETHLPPLASVWIVRPKGQPKSRPTEHDVREGGLARGLVDYKICSVDDAWSGMKFAWRRTGPIAQT